MRTVVAFIVAGIMVCGQARAAIPLQVNYQGKVTVGGVPFTGNGLFRFTLAHRDSSVTLWCNDNSRLSQSATLPPVAAVNLPVINGIFNVRLGDTTIPNMKVLPSTVFSTDRVTLRVWFDDGTHGNQLLLPDQPITSVAYAFHALLAETATTAVVALNSARLQGLLAGDLQRRVTGTAPAGRFVRAINADGSVVTSPAITGITAATGLLGGGAGGNVSLSANTTYLQRRITGTASTGRFIRAINADGTVATSPAVTGINAGAGLSGGGTGGNVSLLADTAYLQRRVVGVASPGEFIRAINPDGSIITGIDQTTGGPAAWLLEGNVGTMPGTNFLGTRDNTPLELRVNNVPALQIHPTTGPPNLIAGSPDNFFKPGSMGATIGGGGSAGKPNRVTDDFGTVGGGLNNQVGDDDQSTTNATHASVGGGVQNAAVSSYATVGGGAGNTAGGPFAAIGGGDWNFAGMEATVGGGGSNNASGDAATVGGGWINEAVGPQATVGGGYWNLAAGMKSTVGGGYGNSATSYTATVAGGDSNMASGVGAAVPGGVMNTAHGDYSFAAGNMARADHVGTFVWASNGSQEFSSTGDQQFLIDAAGGVGINTNKPTPFALRVKGPAGLEGSLDMGAGGMPMAIVNVGDPMTSRSAATKLYVDNLIGKAMLPNYITGCELEWMDNNTIRVAPGSIELAGTLLTSGTYSPSLDVRQPGNWLRGSTGPNKWIYVYLGADGPRWKPYFSADPPDTNDTFGHIGGTPRYRNYAGQWYRCVGTVRTDSTANLIRFYQSGNLILYDSPKANSVLSDGTATSWTIVNCSSYVPAPLSSSVGLGWETVEDTDFYLRKAGSSSAEGIHINPDAGESGVADHIPVDANGKLEYKVTANGVSLYVKNYGLELR